MRPLAVSLAALALLAGAAPAGARPRAIGSPVGLANRCVAIASPARTGPLFVKPTALGRAMLENRAGRLVGLGGGRVRTVDTAAGAGPADEWHVVRAGPRAFALRATRAGRWLVPTAGGLALRTGRERLTLVRATGCRRFPEAQVDASGRAFAPTRRDGSLVGFADYHLHVTANLRAGGDVISGEPFDRFGIVRALGRDAAVHGADGSKDVTGNLLRDGVPFGSHATQGWPGFTGWPVHDTNTHQQAYYVWLERAWRAGMRLMVAQTVEDDELCRVEPRRAHSCSEPATIAREVGVLRGLQDYVDAQAGGRGRGWLRLVYGPRQARRAIVHGQLAVVVGVESSNLFGCSLRPGAHRCTKGDVDRGLARYRRLGVRAMFVAHWFDNAFAGAALEGDGKGKLIAGLDRLETGRWFATAPCPHPGMGEVAQAPSSDEAKVLAAFFPAVRPLLDDPAPAYPATKRCNARGLTALGRYLIGRMMATHTLIEVDHMSERAREAVLALARAHRYPLVSSHNGTGGEWTMGELRRLRALGGAAAATPGTAPDLIAHVRRLTGAGFAGVGLGTDTGGFASLPGPRADARAHPLRYPFRSFRGRVTFRRERAGTRTWDLNRDGVAQYGLVADLLADAGHHRGGGRALAALFRGADAYVRMWRRAGAAG